MAETTTPAPRPSTSAGPSGPGGKKRGFVPRRKVCRFCADQVFNIDYKQVQVLRSFMTERGKILSSRVTGVCAGHQRQLAKCIKRVRTLSLLPYVNS